MNARYDTVEGIEEYLKDLEGLNRLVEERLSAGYTRHERLGQFIILGHWATDSCGNFGVARFFDANYKPIHGVTLPKVVPYEALAKFGLENLKVNHRNQGIPKSHLICSECDKGWTIENAFDTQVEEEDRIVTLTPGKTIAEREKDWGQDSEGTFRFGPEPCVRNAKFIDLSPYPEYKGQVANEKGWRHKHPPFNRERLTHDYVAEEGDKASIYVTTYRHKRCHDLRKLRLARVYFEDMFKRAGLPNAVLYETPNEYCPCEVCNLWFIAKIPAGDIKIGWRKSVINIDWSATGHNLDDLFNGEDVTKSSTYIHAWGTDKAVEYLRRINEALS